MAKPNNKEVPVPYFGQGIVYILHLERPFGHARHYIGYTKSWMHFLNRMEEHYMGRRSIFMSHVRDAGIGFSISRVYYDATRDFERYLKNMNSTGLYCGCGKGHNGDFDSTRLFVKGEVGYNNIYDYIRRVDKAKSLFTIQKRKKIKDELPF